MNVQNVETNESHFMTFESVEDLIDFFPEFGIPNMRIAGISGTQTYWMIGLKKSYWL